MTCFGGCRWPGKDPTYLNAFRLASVKALMLEFRDDSSLGQFNPGALDKDSV
jgi:hypothetical protein